VTLGARAQVHNTYQLVGQFLKLRTTDFAA